MLAFRSVLLFVCSTCFVLSCSEKNKNSVTSVPPPPPTSTGETLYNQLCASCHGISGMGDGPAGSSLNPKPRNFQKDIFQAGASLKEIKNTIANGFKNGSTGMIGWRSVFNSPKELEDVARYVLKLKNGIFTD